MEKPFAVIVKDESSETTTDRDTDKNTSVNYVVKALIKKKLLFKQRPKPIIANIPKKLWSIFIIFNFSYSIIDIYVWIYNSELIKVQSWLYFSPHLISMQLCCYS